MADHIWAIPLALSDFNILVAFLGGWIALYGLVSYLLKENYYLSEALISLLAGVAFGPHAANWIRPDDYAQCNVDGISFRECQGKLDAITLNFSRLVLAVQLVLAGVQLPSKYLKTELKPILLLVGPIMTCMWLATSLLVWGLAQTPSFLQALAIGACVTPTDPVLSAVIVKGKFADHNIPKELQNLIVAESGANDGLGYPFLFFALYLIKYVGAGATSGNAGNSFGLWFGMTLGYVIALSIIYGGVVGFIAKELLRWARRKKYVDDESFLVFAIALALFILGTCGMIGTDDVLACFVAGNTFTWDDWFRLETKDDSLQPTIDMLLNVAIFMWYGAVVPWIDFGSSHLIPVYRLIPLGILVLLFRRVPWVFAAHKWIPQIEQVRQALFVGFFGPIGVSGIFYLFILLEFTEKHLSDVDGVPRSDVKDLAETARVVVWFMAVSSVVVHGLSIPLGKVGYIMPRTISRVLTQNEVQEKPQSDPFRHLRKIPLIGGWLLANREAATLSMEGGQAAAPKHVRRLGPDAISHISSPKDARKIGESLSRRVAASGAADADGGACTDLESGQRTPVRREIRFHDEDLPRTDSKLASGQATPELDHGGGRLNRELPRLGSLFSS